MVLLYNTCADEAAIECTREAEDLEATDAQRGGIVTVGYMLLRMYLCSIT